MTDEQARAMEVWRKACGAYEDGFIPLDPRP